MVETITAPGERAVDVSPFEWTGAPPPAGSPAPGDTPPNPDAAVRARISAIVIDSILLGIAAAGLALALGSGVRSPDAPLLFLGLQFLYFFAFELGRGQTIGKRQYHLHVVSRDGSPLTMRQVAIRNALRFIDVLPLCYASGLISMMRTGRARRQRIGDVAAGTLVVLDPQGRPLRTPRALLPLATVLALLLSVGWIEEIVTAPATTQGASSAPLQLPPLTGFSGPGVLQQPLPGTWLAHGSTGWSVGYSNTYVGEQVNGDWTITRSCSTASRCSFALTLPLQGNPVTERLVPEANGWHVTFDVGQYPCTAADGTPSSWLQQESMILRFSDGGRAAAAYAENSSHGTACGYAGNLLSLTATLQ